MTTQPGILFCPHPPVLVPEIGQGRELDASLTLDGFEAQQALIEGWEFDSVLCLSPHAPMFSDAACVMGFKEFSEGLSNFGLQDGLSWQLDEALLSLCLRALAKVVPTVLMDERMMKKYNKSTIMDHGSAVPLTLLPAVHGKPIVIIAPGSLNARALYEMGKALAKAIDAAKLRVLVVASGDMAHCHGGTYPYKPEGARFDSLVREALERGARERIVGADEALVEESMQCSYPSFVTALGMLDGKEARFKVHSYEAPFGVGYLTASASLTGKSAPELGFFERDPFVALARGALEKFVRDGKSPEWSELKDGLPDDFVAMAELRRAGAFVSLHKGGSLRGCIGTISATRPTLAEELIYCACEAAGSDPRFSKVEEDELMLLDVKADILGEAEPVESMEELDARRYGVIVRNGYRRGLLLPDLEGVDTVLRQVEIAKSKAGIREDEDAEFSRFKVERHVSDFEVRSKA